MPDCSGKMGSLKSEMLAFLVAIISGMIVRLGYQFLVCLRKIVKHKKTAINIEDFCFWILTAVFLFVQIYHTTNGMVRWFVVLGIVLGAFFLNIFLGKIEKRIEKNCKNDISENIAKKKKNRYYNNIKGE